MEWMRSLIEEKEVSAKVIAEHRSYDTNRGGPGCEDRNGRLVSPLTVSDGHADCAQDTALDFSQTQSAQRVSEWIAFHISHREGGHLFTFEHRGRRDAPLSAPKAYVSRRFAQVGRTGYDQKVGGSCIARVNRDHQHRPSFVGVSPVEVSAPMAVHVSPSAPARRAARPIRETNVIIDGQAAKCT